MAEHYIPLPFGERPPLHANQRLNRFEHAKQVRKVKDAVMVLAKQHHLGTGHERIRVRLIWRPSTVRRRDGNENLGPLVKALVDGVVAAGVVGDDAEDQVERLTPVILPPDPAKAGLWLFVDTDPGGGVES